MFRGVLLLVAVATVTGSLAAPTTDSSYEKSEGFSEWLVDHVVSMPQNISQADIDTVKADFKEKIHDFVDQWKSQNIGQRTPEEFRKKMETFVQNLETAGLDTGIDLDIQNETGVEDFFKNFKAEVKHRINELMSKVKERLQDLPIADDLAKIEEFTNELKDEIKLVIDDLITKFEQFREAMPENVTEWEEFISKVKTEIEQKIDVVISKFKQGLDDLGITEEIAKMKGVIDQFKTDIKARIANAINEFRKRIDDSSLPEDMAKLEKFIKDLQDELKHKIDDFIFSHVNATLFREELAKAKAFVEVVTAEMREAVDAFIQHTREALESLPDTIFHWNRTEIEEVFEKIREETQKHFKEWAQEIKEFYDHIIEYLPHGNEDPDENSEASDDNDRDIKFNINSSSNSKDTGDSNSKDTGDSKSKDTGDSNSKDIGDSNSKDTGDSNSKDTGDSNSKDTGDSNSKDIGDSNSKDTGDSNSKDTGDSNSKEFGGSSERDTDDSNNKGESHDSDVQDKDDNNAISDKIDEAVKRIRVLGGRINDDRQQIESASNDLRKNYSPEKLLDFLKLKSDNVKDIVSSSKKIVLQRIQLASLRRQVKNDNSNADKIADVVKQIRDLGVQIEDDRQRIDTASKELHENYSTEKLADFLKLKIDLVKDIVSSSKKIVSLRIQLASLRRQESHHHYQSAYYTNQDQINNSPNADSIDEITKKIRELETRIEEDRQRMKSASEDLKENFSAEEKSDFLQLKSDLVKDIVASSKKIVSLRIQLASLGHQQEARRQYHSANSNDAETDASQDSNDEQAEEDAFSFLSMTPEEEEAKFASMTSDINFALQNSGEGSGGDSGSSGTATTIVVCIAVGLALGGIIIGVVYKRRGLRPKTMYKHVNSPSVSKMNSSSLTASAKSNEYGAC